MKLRSRTAALAIAGSLLFGGAIAAPLVAPATSAQADTLIRTYKVKTSAQCYTEIQQWRRTWCVSFYPGLQSNCDYQKKRALCGGKF